MKAKTRFTGLLIAVLALALVSSSWSFAQDRQAPPPEYKELGAAMRMKDAAARLKEMERIKAAYPKSQFAMWIDRGILSAKIELADGLSAVLALQKGFLANATGPDRLGSPFEAAAQILRHPKLKMFKASDVLTAVLKYKEESLKAAEDPGSYQGVPQDQQKSFKAYFVTGFDILTAQAYVNAGDAAKAMAALDGFKKDGGALDETYYYTFGGALAKMGKTKEAYEAYLTAAVDNNAEALSEARALYVKLNGRAEGFEAALEAKLKALPYTPGPFKAPADWKGKAVLMELFTGSECPPCVGADLGFDGLIETYPAKYVAVLEYHLPIPAPDPMINPATKKRQEYYGVNSTPTVVVDGEKDTTGGGSRGRAEAKYEQYKAAVDTRLGGLPAVVLKLRAVRAGDTVKIDYDSGGAVSGAEYHAVLVQGEEKFKGSNGLMVHKMVVRDILAVEPGAAKHVSFDLAASEVRTDQYLTEFEKTYTRIKDFKFAERHHKIDRSRLRVVLFAQDKGTKKVLNAVVADVK
jgi:tetratricopeptide (TPR) repeat protein